ncbi:hypothetical protein [Desulfatitalea alkaliphila]|uniref:Uncharacterized protein n=1 Tax=Desulfatitalea alkaliphila TaxID=2929485 RepID=A0AA41URI0_9BACT|nr:hypothetical protein [Desulfatitalea alkaliphila]MCJ8502378.1 hypothetical protein [Desulfatitalea alkaliphila]
MKQLTSIALILLLSAFVMVGCSQKSGTEGQAEAPAETPVGTTAEQALDQAADTMTQAGEQAAEAMEQARESGADVLEQVREEGADALEQAEESASQAMDKMAEGASKAADEARQMAESVTEQGATQMDGIRGTLVETEQGVALFSDMGNFVLAGQDLDAMVGKDVLVSGTVQEGEGVPVLNISSISVVE